MSYFYTFQQIKSYLLKQSVPPSILFPKYKIFYLPCSTPTNRFLRIEELSDGLFGTSIGAKTRPIGSIDLEINKEKSFVEIQFWMINDQSLNKRTNKLYNPPLPDDQAQEIKEILIRFAESTAREHNIKMIKRDVHQSLREFNNDIKQFGFELNGEKADDHSAWLKTFKQLN
jgi:hypothetical protein